VTAICARYPAFRVTGRTVLAPGWLPLLWMSSAPSALPLRARRRPPPPGLLELPRSDRGYAGL